MYVDDVFVIGASLEQDSSRELIGSFIASNMSVACPDSDGETAKMLCF